MRAFLMASVLILSTLGFAHEASAQMGVDRFASGGACDAALKSGNFKFYQPSFFTPKPIQGNERVVPLEHDACVRMQIVGSIAWVPQRMGTNFVFDGTTPNRRQDCGNRTYDILYPTSSVVMLDEVKVFAEEEAPLREYNPPAPVNVNVTASSTPWWKTWPVIGGTVIIGGCVASWALLDRPCIQIRQWINPPPDVKP